MEKIFVHPDLGEIKLTKRSGNKNIRITVTGKGGIRVSLPWYSTYSRALRFVEQNKEWIKGRLSIQASKGIVDADAANLQIEQMRKQAKEVLPARLASLASKYGFTYNRVAIKNNRSNWGSCSGKNNINLNLQLVRLPDELIDFVLLHELCHLKHHNHGTNFHVLLNSLCDGKEKELSRQLKNYKLL
ncbi:MAG: DUF45 domain-containing protein [Bacteroidales bacterium]|nr:DUF45 domain-containing protein [Bacteroidales bacterium]